MFTRIRTFVLWIWMVSLLGATVGISIHRIYCHCLGTTTVSLFDETTDACQQKKEDTPLTCCSKEAADCCARPPLADDPHASGDCTSKTVQVFILKTEYLVVQPFEKTFDLPIWAEELPEYFQLFQPAICLALPDGKEPPEPAPPRSGRFIRLLQQSFRC